MEDSVSEKIKYDIVVCGAGVAGIASAIAAARLGKRVALIEKQCLIGGLATSGLIYIYLPLCDGRGKQLIGGIADEMIRRCTEYGPFDIPEKFGGPAGGDPGINGDRFRCCFSPAGFTLTLDKMLVEAGVDLWLDSVVTNVTMEQRIIKSVNVFNSSGNLEVFADQFVDASGGGYLAAMAGCKTIVTANRLTPWVMEMAEDPSFYHFTESLHIQGVWNCGASPDGLDDARFGTVYEDCTNGKAVTDFVREGWSLVRQSYVGRDPKKNYPVHLPAMPQLRKIAYIETEFVLRDDDHSKEFPDSIGEIVYWRYDGNIWQTPYRSLLPKAVDNLLAAGRCMGAENVAMEVFRVIPAAAMTGEAAGTAAALSINENCQPRELDYNILNKNLHTRA